ncbi:hypothetical protein EV175_001782 [Coemansia sp. RSA 1933]|nr:hypothetical protein EV175_001782 [Coemansia sp. RSA 1933]
MAVDRVYGWAKQQTYCFLYHTPALQDDGLFTTSWFVPQPALCAARATVFAYSLGVLVANLAVNVEHGAGWNWAAYFTTLTYVGIAMYFGVAAYNTAIAWRQRRATERSSVAAVQQLLIGANEEIDEGDRLSMRSGQEIDSSNSSDIVELASSISRRSSIVYVDALGDKAVTEDHAENGPDTGQILRRRSTGHQALLAAQWILYESFTCFAPLVTIVYWALLYPMDGGFSGPADEWMGVSMHAINTVLMCVEVGVLSRIPYAMTHLAALLTFLTLYLGLTYFMVAVYGFYVYPFFEARYFGGYIAIVCLLVVNIVAIVWVVLLFFHYWRDRTYPQWAAALKMRQLQQQGNFGIGVSSDMQEHASCEK